MHQVEVADLLGLRFANFSANKPAEYTANKYRHGPVGAVASEQPTGPALQQEEGLSVSGFSNVYAACPRHPTLSLLSRRESSSMPIPETLPLVATYGIVLR